MRKKVSLGVTVSLMLISAAIATSIAVMLTWKQFSLTLENFSERQAMYNKLGMIDSKVKENFYGNIDEEKLLDNLAGAYIATLNDRFSGYMNAEDYSKQSLNSEGKAVGIGVTVTKTDEGLIKVLKLEKNAPADKAGVLPGDIITDVAGKKVADLGYEEAVNQMLGKIGTTCEFTVKRGEETKHFSVKRTEYESTSVEYRKIGTLGYIKISAFHDNTDAQFKTAVEALQKENVTGLIFDVRSNGGGTLNSVSKMIDLLVPEGDIVSITTKDNKTEVLHKSDKNEVDLPMAVLVNDGTASASELFAAALRDYEKAEIIGTLTYGKGVMQKTFDLDDGSAVRVTVGLFNPPSGKNFNDKGIEPDIVVALTEEQKEKYLELTDETDPQIQAAVNHLNGNSVGN